MPLFLALIAGCGTSHDRGGEEDDGGIVPADSAPADSGRRDAGRRDAAIDEPHWSACEESSECVVMPASCCGNCGAPAPMDMVGVNVSRLSDQRGEACGGGDVACPACAAMPDPHLIATCDVDTCQAIDLRNDPATECSSDSDCRLWVARCNACVEVADAEIIGVSDVSRIFDLLCDDGAAPPPCAPVLPDYLEPWCDAGRCAARVIGG